MQIVDAGGTGDLRRKALFPFLQKYIPGNPTIVSDYMPGGGGRKAANHVYRVARPDGLTIGGMSSSLVTNAILDTGGVQYDIDKLIYLGSPVSVFHYVFLTRKEAGLGSLEKLRAATGVTNRRPGGGARHLYHRAAVCLFDESKGAEIRHRLRRAGNRHRVGAPRVGRQGECLGNIGPAQRRRDEKRTARPPRARRDSRRETGRMGFRACPKSKRFAKSETERKLLAMYRAFRLVGTPYILAPGTPKPQVQILQDAMRKALKDPEFHREFKKLSGFDASPLMPEEQEKAIRELPRDREVVELFKKLSGPDPLPAR